MNLEHLAEHLVKFPLNLEGLLPTVAQPNHRLLSEDSRLLSTRVLSVQQSKGKPEK